jgi:hypothetical protein
MDKTGLFSRPNLYIAILLYFALGFATLAFGERAAAMLFDEDRYFENIGAISLFIASALSFYTFYLAWKARKTAGIFWGKYLAYLGLALLYFFGGGEEISWGQRIFGIEEPAGLAEENVQQELNVHNLAIFENSTLLKADNIFSVFWLGFAVLVPLGSLLFDPFRKLASLWMPIAHWAIGCLFLANYALASLSKMIFAGLYSFEPVPFIQAVQEIKESNYEFLFVFLALFVLWDFTRSMNGQPSKKEPGSA